MQHLRQHPEDTTENQFLKLCQTSLEVSSRQAAPQQIPSWTLTAYDVDVNPLSSLGSGGYGEVKEGRFGGIDVAVKFMAKETSKKVRLCSHFICSVPSTFCQMLFQEIEIWERLRHDHIVPFYGASVAANPPFIVSKLMRGGNLTTYAELNPNANLIIIVRSRRMCTS